MTKFLILVALQSELIINNIPKTIPIVYTGVGKVNAALITKEAIDYFRPDKIINFGTAGGISNRHSGLLKVSRVIQRDMIAEPISPRGITPMSPGPHEYWSEDEGITCGTGDSFVKSYDEWLEANNVDIVDMELFAIAAAAYRASIPWSSYKYISDHADENAALDWKKKINNGENLFLNEIEKLVII